MLVGGTFRKVSALIFLVKTDEVVDQNEKGFTY